MTPIFILNLLQDEDRRTWMQAQMERLADVQFIFINAVDGSTLPDSVCTSLAGAFWAKSKGTIGCFLSHVRAWEHVAQQTTPFAVVLEDDVSANQLSTLSAIELPDDFDIVFINDRLSPGVTPDGSGVADMATTLRHSNMHQGAGSDGYLLTPSAAEKLLAAVATDGYAGHIDGRLLRYASTEEDVAALGPESYTATVIRTHHGANPPALGLLKGYATALPLVRNMAWKSTREAADASSDHNIRVPVYTETAVETSPWPDGFSSVLPVTDASWTDHARGKPACQSSHSDWSVGRDAIEDAGRAVLGKPQPPYAFHTQTEDTPWWQVDFGEPQHVKHVTVANRYDNPAFASRATPLVGAISDDGKIWHEVFRTPDDLPFGQDGRPLVWTSGTMLKSRYFRLSVPRWTCLHLAQVQIFGPSGG